MAFKDRISRDISVVFMNQGQFGETHYWDGFPIQCVPDEEEALKRKNNNVNDVSWDNNIRNILLHTPLSGFPGGEPTPNSQHILDNRAYKILSVDCDCGMLEIMLAALESREY